MNGPWALVVEGDAEVRALLVRTLEQEGLQVVAAEGSADALERVGRREFDLVVTALGPDGLDLRRLPRAGEEPGRAAVLLGIAAADDAAEAAEALKAGAADVLTRPLSEARLRPAVQKALRQRLMLEELGRLRDELRTRVGPGGLVGRSPAVVELRERLAELARADQCVWLAGEVGSGRELAARTLHALSARASGPFVVARGGAAVRDELVQRAAGGVLYLDGVPALSPELQARLAELLAPPLGLRVCCSSIEPLSTAVGRGRVAPALLARLPGPCVHVPPLRERVEDIPLLARHFVRAVCSINFLPPIPIDPAALELLEAYAWPENVRELRQAMEQAVIVSMDGTIRPRDLPEPIRRAQRAPDSAAATRARRFREAKREVVDRFERAYLEDLMRLHAGNVTAAASQAGMLRSALQRLLRKHRIRSSEFRGATPGDPTRQPD